MPDPYHIAQYISSALQKDKFDEALMMTRMASRNKKVEVSWNHLIDYLLKKHRLNAAIKLYNEVRPSSAIPGSFPPLCSLSPR
jgi:pentatricopeptide repeat protein